MSIDPALVAATLAPVHTFGYELWVAWDGVTFVDETPYVSEHERRRVGGSSSRALNAAEANVELDNASRRYDPDNADGPLYSYLTHPGHKAYIRLGYNGVLAKIGTFWIDSLTPTEASRTVSLRLLDRLETLARATVNYGPSSAVRLDNVARGLLTAAGLTEGEHFVLDVAETTAVWAVAVAANPVAELADLALAEGGRIYRRRRWRAPLPEPLEPPGAPGGPARLVRPEPGRLRPLLRPPPAGPGQPRPARLRGSGERARRRDRVRPEDPGRPARRDELDVHRVGPLHGHERRRRSRPTTPPSRTRAGRRGS